MFENVADSLMAKGARMVAAKGGLICPGCGAHKTDVPGDNVEVLHCAVCGYDGSVGEWLAAKTAGGGEIRVDPDAPPFGTKIARRKLPGGTVEWDIPASGKGGGLLFFSAFWNGFMVLMSCAMVPAMLAGNLHAKSGGESPAWVVALFFMLFWAVGLGLLYAGLRAKYAKHRIAVGAGEVKMTREMFGRAKTKALAWKDVTEVQKKEFYQQNYKPVYGIEIKGKDGKLRFGSMLTEEEKGWLVADMRRVVFGEPVLSRRAESSTREASEIRLSSSDGKFSVTMPRAAAAGITGLVFTLFGGGFVGIGIFVLPSGRFGAGHPLHKSSTDWFDMISGTFDSGFKVIWTLFSSIFLIAGIGLLVSWVRNLGVETKIEGDGFRIAIRKYKGGGVVSEKAFPRESLKAVRAYNSGTNNGKTMKAVELLFEGHAEKIARWMDGEKADALVEKIRRGAGMS